MSLRTSPAASRPSAHGETCGPFGPADIYRRIVRYIIIIRLPPLSALGSGARNEGAKLQDYISAFHNTSSAAAVIISVALMLFSGFMATRLTKRLRLPDVTAYIVSGILIGPYCLRLVPQKIIDGMDFLPDIALAFIAFSTGEFFRMSVLFR